MDPTELFREARDQRVSPHGLGAVGQMEAAIGTRADCAQRRREGPRFGGRPGRRVFKQRVARKGGGKSGGFRTIILFRGGSHSFFAHGCAQADKANVSAKELKALKRLGDVLLGISDEQLKAAQAAGELSEVESDGGDEEED